MGVSINKNGKSKTLKSAPQVDNDDDTPPFPMADAKPGKPAKKPAKSSPELDSALKHISKIEHVQPKATITKKHSTGVETAEEEPVGPVVAKTHPMANVGLSVGATVNLGNFNNAKFSVSLFMPSELDKESLDSTFEFINEWVEAKATALHAELSEEE